MAVRVTLSRHRVHSHEHIDLFFHAGAALPTVSLSTTRGRMHARRLPDHRRRYAHWSGTLSQGRGRVQVLGHTTAQAISGRHFLSARLCLPAKLFQRIGLRGWMHCTVQHNRAVVVLRARRLMMRSS
jgi:hypothetical protein